MSTTLKVKKGETYLGLSKRAYGSEEYERILRQANPGVVEPISEGTEVYVPLLSEFEEDEPAAPGTSNQVSVLIEGEIFKFWTEIAIYRSLDSLDIIDFSAPFESESLAFREKFRPFSFKSFSVRVGGGLLFSGTMAAILPSVQSEQRVIKVSGYSTPGVLNDCNASASTYPIEYNNLNLLQIANSLCTPFGIKVVLEGEVGATFEKVALSPNGKILDFLAKLASQRGLVLNNTASGALRLQQAVEEGAPVASLQENKTPVISVETSFAPQQYFSHITGLEPVGVGKKGGSYTFVNPFLRNNLRPNTFKAKDVEGGDLKLAVESKACRMFANVASFTVTLATWRDPQGVLWAPNTTIKLQAPGAMIYQSYEFVIRSVRLYKSADKEVADLSLATPGTFRNEIPEVLPWD